MDGQGDERPGGEPGSLQLARLMSALESDGGDPARLLRRVMAHVLEALGAEAVVLVRQSVDGACEIVRAMGSLTDAATEHILGELPRPLAVGHGLVRSDLVVLPADIYHLVALPPAGQELSAHALPMVEVITRHAGRTLENARLRDALAESEGLSAVGKAVRRVLHDLRNPLGRIQVAVERASVPDADAETLQRMHMIIASAADDMLSMASEVNDFTGSSKLTRIWLTVESLLVALGDSAARSGLVLRCTNEHAGALHCDAQKLLRALSRLIEGAAACCGGDVIGPREVTVRATQDGAGSVITISSRGGPLLEALRATLFDPFSPQSLPGPQGLALATARSIVRAHGGDLRLDGDGDACRLVVRLPAAGDGPARMAR